MIETSELEELQRELVKRATSCRALAFEHCGASEQLRLRSKAAAYAHAAEMVQEVIEQAPVKYFS